MTTISMLRLLPAAFGTFLLTASPAGASDLTPAVVTNLAGTLRIVQNIPCDQQVNKTTSVTGGRIELTPAEGVRVTGGRVFSLVRANVAFAPFSASSSCLGVTQTLDYTTLKVQFGRAATFTAIESSPGVFSMTIPKNDVSIYEGIIVNGQAQNGYQRPNQDVTGSIDLNTGAFSMHVVVHQTIHFEGSTINEDDEGTMTVDVSGTIVFPDADRDGVPDRSDNCRFVANSDQSPVPTPTIDAPHDVTLSSCLGRTIGFAVAADVCDGGHVSVTNNAPAQFVPGANAVTWTARDSKDRTATDTQLVTIVDQTRPTFTFVPLDIHVFDCGPVNLGQATATDDCAGTPTITNDSPGYFYVGTTPVTWKATDASGNFSTAVQKVTVTDLVPPTVSCTATNPLGTSFIVSGFDACGAAVLTLGSYVIANGEQIKIEETGQPGVRLQNVVSKDGIRKFFVGKGQGIILATDGSGDTSTAICRYPGGEPVPDDNRP